MVSSARILHGSAIGKSLVGVSRFVLRHVISVAKKRYYSPMDQSDRSELEHPDEVARLLRVATSVLDLAASSATVRENGSAGLTGLLATAIGGLSQAVVSLQCIVETGSIHD